MLSDLGEDKEAIKEAIKKLRKFSEDAKKCSLEIKKSIKLLGKVRW